MRGVIYSKFVQQNKTVSKSFDFYFTKIFEWISQELVIEVYIVAAISISIKILERQQPIKSDFV